MAKHGEFGCVYGKNEQNNASEIERHFKLLFLSISYNSSPHLVVNVTQNNIQYYLTASSGQNRFP